MLEDEALVVKVGEVKPKTKTYAVELSELLGDNHQGIRLDNLFAIYFSIDEDNQVVDIEILK